MNELNDRERSEKYKQLYNSELALRLDLQKEVNYLNETIWKQEYPTPEKVAEDRKKTYLVNHADVQEAINHTAKYLNETKPDSQKVFVVEHLKQLYKIQIALLGRIE